MTSFDRKNPHFQFVFLVKTFDKPITMKHTATILVKLLLLGVYSARTVDTSGSHSVSISDLPDLADPVNIGNSVDRSTVIVVKYENVQFQGLKTAHDSVLKVNVNTHVATLTLNLRTAEVHGHFEFSNVPQKSSGNFNTKMSGDITFVCTYPYKLQNINQVQLQGSSGKLHYGSYISHYDTLGIPQNTQGVLESPLTDKVNEKLHAEVHAKLSDRVLKYIQEIVLDQINNRDSSN